MLDICSLGDLLTYLAGNFNRSRSYNTVSTSLSLRENGVQILIKVIHPLLTNHELGELKHAVGVTSVMLQQGLLTCLHEVDEYLIHLGRVSNFVYIEISELMFCSYLRGLRALI